MKYSTEQEDFWAGEFGDSYVDRSQGLRYVAADTALFARILGRTSGISSVLEFGANIGLNLLAIRNLIPDLELSAIEINAKAVAELRKIPALQVFSQSLVEFRPDRRWDMVLSKGVLIHLAPSVLESAYDLMYESSSRYICFAEYYNASPVEIPYREHTGKLYKRDFAGDMIDRYPDLRLVDYGFVYRHDPNFRQDDLTWFLLEKRVV
jgi:pseudaminic acid biosynthesis-associated methylase